MIRNLITLVVAATAVSWPLAAEATDVFAFVEKSCVACHNAKLRSGDVDLKTLHTAKTFEDDREIWEKVVAKLQTGKMPPPGTPQPPATTTSAVTGWLQSEFARQDRMVKPDAGHVTARRLNRAEYNNTVRDLLGIDIRPADNFPADTAAYGFDNNGDALILSPALLENYVDAAERAVRTALFGPERRKPSAVHYSAPVRMNDAARTILLTQGSVQLRFDGLEHHPLHARGSPLSRGCRIQLPPGAEWTPSEPVRTGASRVFYRRQDDSGVRSGRHGPGRPGRRAAHARHGRRAFALGVLPARLPWASA